MTVSVSSFRTSFSEFEDPSVYGDSDIEFWLQYGLLLLNPVRWGNVLDLGIQLFIAHNLVLEQQAKTTSKRGAVPGLNSGVIASKSVDKVSISYDTNSAMEKDAGQWNLTIYGSRYFKLMRMFGAGPIQVGIGFGGATAWPGVIPPNF